MTPKYDAPLSSIKMRIITPPTDALIATSPLTTASLNVFRAMLSCVDSTELRNATVALTPFVVRRQRPCLLRLAAAGTLFCAVISKFNPRPSRVATLVWQSTSPLK